MALGKCKLKHFKPKNKHLDLYFQKKIVLQKCGQLMEGNKRRPFDNQGGACIGVGE